VQLEENPLQWLYILTLSLNKDGILQASTSTEFFQLHTIIDLLTGSIYHKKFRILMQIRIMECDYPVLLNHGQLLELFHLGVASP
jgi:hypothetical protein